jgi:hypothetical protein
MRMQLLAIALSTLIAPRLLYAQETTQQWPGLVESELSTVYVLDDAGTETTGKLVRLNPDSIVILVDGGERRFEAAHVRRVQKRGDSVKNGAIIGAVVGAVLGAIGSGIADCPGSGSGGCAAARVGMFAVSTGVYTAIGAGIDSLIAGRTTVYSAPRAGAVRSAVTGTPGAAFRFTVRVPIPHKAGH